MPQHPTFPLLVALSLCVAPLGCDDGKPTSDGEASSTATPDAADKTKSKKDPAGPTRPAAEKLAPGLSEGEVIVGSCNTEGVDSECADAVAKTGDEASIELAKKQLTALCKMGKGATSDKPCANGNVVGRCRAKLEFGKDRGDRAFQYVAHYLSSGKTPYDTASAEKHCANKRKGGWHKP